MRPRRRIVTAVVSIVCLLAMAACGQQVVAHISAGDTVDSALTALSNAGNTQFQITAQGLPGSAALLDGTFSINATVSKDATASSSDDRSITVTVDHESTQLAAMTFVNGNIYASVDLKDILAFDNPGEYSKVAAELDTMATRPDLGFLRDIAAGRWIGVSTSTYEAVSRNLLKQMEKIDSGLSNGLSSSPEISRLEKLLDNPKEVATLRAEGRNALEQSVKAWLTIHQTGSGKYSADLPVRSFVTTLVDKLIGPIESLLDDPALNKELSGSSLSSALARIPASLALRANLWVSNGSLTKVQAFIPDTAAYLMIGVSHPAQAVSAPSGATMLTEAELEALFSASIPGSLGSGSIPKLPASLSGLSSQELSAIATAN